MLLSLGSDSLNDKYINGKHVEAIEAFPNAAGELTVKIYMASGKMFHCQMTAKHYRAVLDTLADCCFKD